MSDMSAPQHFWGGAPIHDIQSYFLIWNSSQVWCCDFD